MRIAHVVTLQSMDGAFGGPVSVMRQQTRELARRGHDVTVFCGWDGRAALDTADRLRTRGYSTYQAVPGLRFAGMTAPRLLAELRKTAASFDVVHVHLARDLVTMPAAHLAARHQRVVVQTHGMIVPDARVAARIFDAALTRRTLRDAQAVLSLTAAEDAAISVVTRHQVTPTRLRNGIAASEASEARLPRKVVFCARLHPRKRVMAFVAMAELLAQRGVQAQYVIAGPDEGDLDAVQARIATLPTPVDISYVGALSPADVQRLLASARAFVLPSVDEPFPMTVLEAMALGTPAVVTESCGIADEVRRSGGAVVTDGSPARLANAVQRLLDDDGHWETQSAEGKHTVREIYSIESVVHQLEAVYANV